MPASPATAPSVIIETAFTQTVEITDELAAPPTSVDSVVTYIEYDDNGTTVTQPKTFDGITITKGSTNVTIAGKYSAGLFPSATIKYFTRGLSDKLETPTVVSSFDDIPPGKQVFEYNATKLNLVTAKFVVNITDSTSNVANVMFTQDVEFNYDKGALALKAFI
jgi:hypothetical protein